MKHILPAKQFVPTFTPMRSGLIIALTLAAVASAAFAQSRPASTQLQPSVAPYDTSALSPGSDGGAAGDIAVLDTDNQRVEIFNSRGNYVSQFGHGFSLPTGIALDADDIYVKDGNLNCQADKFDAEGIFLLQFGVCSSGTIGLGIFDNIGSVVADHSGNVWVTSPDYYYMQKIDASGNFLSIVCMANVLSGCPPATSFSVQPYGIALDARGNIYVTNVYPFNGGFNVVKFNGSGVYMATIGSSGSGNGQFNDPQNVAIDASGNIYVADSGNNRIEKFGPNGKYLSQFGSFGSGDGQFSYPVGLAFDNGGNIYVSDVGNNRIQKFDSDGKYLSQFGSYGSGNGQFFAPYGVVVGK
jgi:hypothetical protein